MSGRLVEERNNNRTLIRTLITGPLKGNGRLIGVRLLNQVKKPIALVLV